MTNRFSRTQLLYGKNAMEILAHSHVAVFGVGGVGGYTVEALTRSGIGAIDIIGNDTVFDDFRGRNLPVAVNKGTVT